MIAGPSGPAPPCCPVAKSAGDGPPPGHAGPFRGVQPLPCFRSLRSLPCPAGIIRGVFRACERFFTIAHAFPYPRPRKRPVGPFTGRGGIPQLSPSPSSSPRGAALAPSLDFLAPEGSNGRAVWPVLPARRPKAGRLAGVVLAPASGGTLSTVAAKPRARTRASFVKPFVKTFVGDFVTGRKASAGAGFSRFWKIERWQFSERKVAVFRAKVAVFRAESTR